MTRIPAVASETSDSQFLIPVAILTATSSAFALHSLLIIRNPTLNPVFFFLTLGALLCVHLFLLLANESVDAAIDNLPPTLRSGFLAFAIMMSFFYASIRMDGWTVGLAALLLYLVLKSYDAGGFARLYAVALASVVLARIYSPLQIPFWAVPVQCLIITLTMALETAYHSSQARRVAQPNRLHKILFSATWRLLAAAIVPTIALIGVLVYFPPVGSDYMPRPNFASPPGMEFKRLDAKTIALMIVLCAVLIGAIKYFRKKLRDKANTGIEADDEELMWSQSLPSVTTKPPKTVNASPRQDLIRAYYKWAETWNRALRETPSEFAITLTAKIHQTTTDALTAKFEEVRYGTTPVTGTDFKDFKTLISQTNTKLQSSKDAMSAFQASGTVVPEEPECF